MSFRDRLAGRLSGSGPIRVAIVLSGQPRTWRDCLPWWTTLFGDHGEVQFDVFAHIWNFDTVGHGVAAQKVSVDRTEMRDLLGVLKPKKVLIEGPDVIPSKMLLALRRPEDTEPSAVAWQASQFYSTMRAGHLKRVYEIDNRFQYDVCVKGRLDMVFPQPEHLPSAPLPNRHTLYSIHSCFDTTFQHNRTGDIFYYGDSPTFDLAADFFRHLNLFTVSDYTYGGKMMPPEMPFHDYMIEMLGVTEHRLPWGPRLKRPASYAEILKAENRTLGEHETF